MKITTLRLNDVSSSFTNSCSSQAMKRTLNFNGFLKSYMAHLERIMERHGVKDPKAVLAFNELLEYIESRNSKIFNKLLFIVL